MAAFLLATIAHHRRLLARGLIDFGEDEEAVDEAGQFPFTIMDDFPPEIIFHIGMSLPIWKSHPSFNDLLTCMRINKLWHRTLLPILWIVVNLELDSHIPMVALDVHSALIRYLYISRPWPPCAPLPTRLRALELGHVRIKTATDLIRANSQLISLKATFHRGLANKLAAILEPLLHLKELHLLSGDGLPLDQIIVLVSRLPNLQTITLEGFEYMDQGVGGQPLPNLSITKLCLDSEWRRNPAMHRVARCCPNLEEFRFRSFNNDGFVECPVSELVSNLREFCPKLKSLRNIPTQSDCYRSRPTEDDTAHLLQSTDHLAYFDLPMEDFSPRICQALLNPHASCLEAVQIHVQNSSESVFVNVNRVLASCPNLRSFTLSHQFDADISMPENSLALFAEPWICQRLERLVLDGLKVYKPDKLRKRLGNVLLAQLDRQEEEGRHVVRPGEPGDTVRTIKQHRYPSKHELAVNQWTRILAFHPAPDPEFYNKLVQHGWGMAHGVHGYSPLEAAEHDSSRLEKIVQDKVFERVFTMANVREVKLERCDFLRTSNQEWTSVAPAGSP